MTHALLTAAAMRAADAGAIRAGTPGFRLMTRAGAAVAARAAALLETQGRIAVLCGTGNNGGDGFVAAQLLSAEGFAVDVALLGDEARIAGDAAQARTQWEGPVLSPSAIDLGRADLIVDALFGSGLSRDLDGEAAALVERINAAHRPVLSIDHPSGIDGDTGRVRGIAVRARETVTFVRRKPGHLLYPGRRHGGTVHVADIGISDAIVAGLKAAVFANHPDLWRGAFPVPDEEGHKYGRGHTLVLSGGLTQTGAARLSARAALRIGSGLVTLASPAEALAVNAAHLTAIMLKSCDGAAELEMLLQDKRFNALVVGPGLGLGDPHRALIETALDARRALVLDADALTLLAGQGEALKAAAAPCILTPHEGEFQRLFGDAFETLPSKLHRACAAAEATGCILVLKGPDTVIAAPDGRAAINENGSPYLATAGSGDVLAGMIGGLLAQGMPGFEAACAGVWLHGEAGRKLGAGLIAEDLSETVSKVVKALWTL